jgi:hypothetical protein
MIGLVLGGLVLLLLLLGARAFSTASVTTIKSFALWVAALGGLALGALLLLTGRGGIAIFALSLLGPLIWDRLRGALPGGIPGATDKPRSGPMTVDEAYAVLGLSPGASEAEIRASHLRLMRAAHPDNGGSDWLASRINQARDVLLGKTKAGRA